MKVHGKATEQLIRCLLIGVACDMPAGRKVCGFLSYSALLGCCRCLHIFPGTVGNKDYSGFNRCTWKPRTSKDHRSSIKLIQKAKNKTQREKLESKHGCRYSVLLELPYFDPVRMLVVDPMHNLFLGTAKHMIRLWIDNNVLTKEKFEHIQKVVDGMNVPSNIGRIPHKIESSFSGFTADQFKNWTILYSIPCLYGIIDDSNLEYWRHFVLACRLLCKKSITPVDVDTADALLNKFCRRIQLMYGESACTPNMHMHNHLKEVLLDYGPVYAFWLFAYERFNGILQHQPNNNHNIEVQVMRRFLQDQSACTLQSPDIFKDELENFCNLQPSVTGSLLLTVQYRADKFVIVLPSSYIYHVLEEFELGFLKNLLAGLCKVSIEQIRVNSIMQMFQSA